LLGTCQGGTRVAGLVDGGILAVYIAEVKITSIPISIKRYKNILDLGFVKVAEDVDFLFDAVEKLQEWHPIAFRHC
jgi:hypothetical protein